MCQRYKFYFTESVKNTRNNVILTAILAYKASEDEDRASREKRVMPERVKNPRTGEMMRSRGWPSIRKPNRDGTGSK